MENINFNTNDNIFLTGHKGLVGSSIFSALLKNGYKNILTSEKKNLDLRNQSNVDEFINKNKIDSIIIASAKVGGILANQSYPVDFLYDNVMIEMNIIKAAFNNNIKKIIFLGSSCIYPKFSKQPIKEDYLLTGSLETSNEAYALAKIIGVKLCHYYTNNHNVSYRCLMPTNIYGERDKFDPKLGHVIPSLIFKFNKAKEKNEDITIWGDGLAKREFMHADDLADSVLFSMKITHREFFSLSNKNYSHINIGSGEEIVIKDLVTLIANIFDFKNNIIFDHSKPSGTPLKLLDSSRINKLGWFPKIKLNLGLEKVIKNFCS